MKPYGRPAARRTVGNLAATLRISLVIGRWVVGQFECGGKGQVTQCPRFDADKFTHVIFVTLAKREI
jgi:hypothetical protein